MANADSKRAFLALLADLAHVAPATGYNSPADVELTPAQVADVIGYEPETAADAMVDALPAIAAQLRIVDRHPIGYDGIAATVVNALKAAAQRAVFRELGPYIEAQRAEAEADRAWEAGHRVRALLCLRSDAAGVSLQGGL